MGFSFLNLCATCTRFVFYVKLSLLIAVTKFIAVWCTLVISCVTWCWHRGLWLIRHQYHRMVNVKELDLFVMICVCIVTVIFCMYLWYFTKRWVSLQNRRNILPRIKQYKYIGFLWSFLFAPKEVRRPSKFPSDPPHILKMICLAIN